MNTEGRWNVRNSMKLFTENLDILRDDALTGLTYGEDDHLTVIGWFRRRKGGIRLQVVRCSVCSRDEELYGRGLFYLCTNLVNVRNVPCGCSKQDRYTEDQYRVLCKREATRRDIGFDGWATDYKGKSTKLRLICPIHGLWETTSIHLFLDRGNGCLRCGMSRQKRARAPTFEQVVERILSTGKFDEDTEFWRSERVGSQGYTPYIYVKCPNCNTVSESHISGLYKGKVPCYCSRFKQTQGYINIVYDSDMPICIKYGISSNCNERLKMLNAKNTYKFVNYGVWEFPSKSQCWKAEGECKQIFCPVVSKTDMPEGFSETTYIYNIEEVAKIFENNGGIKIVKHNQESDDRVSVQVDIQKSQVVETTIEFN